MGVAWAELASLFHLHIQEKLPVILMNISASRPKIDHEHCTEEDETRFLIRAH